MKKRSSKESAAKLFGVAVNQQGYFTAKQAKEAGYTDAVHGYHVKNGDWERVYRGIYRLVMFPPVQWPDLVSWSLWSRGRDDKPVAVYSHQTAQALSRGTYQPGSTPLHLTVPSSFRKGTPIPQELTLHKADLQPEEIVEEHGIRYTSQTRTQRDLAEAQAPRNRAEPSVSSSRTRPTASGGWAAWQ